MVDVRRCTVAEIQAAPNLAEVVAEYARESSLPELGPVNGQWHTYYALEAAGVFYPIAAFDGEQLAGYVLPIVVVLPHYGVLAATIESFFVLHRYRTSGAGLHLLHQAEALARELGAKALLLSAPAEGALAKLMPRMPGYRHSNDVFVRALA